MKRAACVREDMANPGIGAVGEDWLRASPAVKLVLYGNVESNGSCVFAARIRGIRCDATSIKHDDVFRKLAKLQFFGAGTWSSALQYSKRDNAERNLAHLIIRVPRHMAAPVAASAMHAQGKIPYYNTCF